MEIILQQSLPHQQRAVDAVCNVLDGVHIKPPSLYFENPSIDLSDSSIPHNIKMIQQQLPAAYHNISPAEECLFLDVKMETGTGKTYVYTQTIFELNRRYKINKFIIAVPSLPIKAGTAQFMKDAYARRHFKDVCGYGKDIEVGVLEAQKNKKKGRNYFPSEVSDFVKGSCQNTSKIYVLLVNMHLLTLTSNGMLNRDDYDYGAEGFYRPFDALRATKPFVIIDEPHRFSRDQKAFQIIKDELKPQCIIRYGATFPEIAVGKGKKKTNAKDYLNLLYDLNACSAFNQGLIKGVAKEHLDPPSNKSEKIKIQAIKPKESVVFHVNKKGAKAETITLQIGDSMALVHDGFAGITIQAITKNEVEFSNGIKKSSGMEMDVDIYMTSYQEEMLRLALKRHFETERENFCNRIYKIKSLALFFIDDIKSYRADAEGKAPYLRTAFERILKEQIEVTMQTLNERDTEYRSYLQASLSNLSKCHAGYFSQDNSDSDEEIAKQVNVILRGKKQLLSLKNEDGTYNTLRFLFSKWTLKEGWDNPNVFTIAKLRSSGSENSKLQEVGRGLRLPVDENGNRISNEEFYLNYIVDFTEDQFAQDLVDQINKEIPHAFTISDAFLSAAAEKLGMTADNLFAALLSKQYIDRHMNIKPDNKERFFAEYPIFNTGLSAGKVKDRNKNKPKMIKIQKSAYSEIRELWERINQRYLLFYDAELDGNMENVIRSIFESDVFGEVVITSHREIVRSDGQQMEVVTGTGTESSITRPISYGAFLKRVSQATNLPITVIHKAMCTYVSLHGSVEPRFINEQTASLFCSKFQAWKAKNLQGRFRYAKCDVPYRETALTYADGTPKESVRQGRIGTKILPGNPSDKYLYDAYAYDSPLEKTNLETAVDNVVVYGKIPRKSIAIPTILGGTYSPDFMYVVKRSSGEKEINIVVETKDVKSEDELRETEDIKISCARIFFENLSKEGYEVHFRKQLKQQQMYHIIDSVLRDANVSVKSSTI